MSRRRRKNPSAPPSAHLAPQPTGWQISATEATTLADTAQEILIEIGLADAPDAAVTAVTRQGGHVADGRLCFPRGLLEATLAQARPQILAGQDGAQDLTLGTGTPWFSTGGAAPMVLDLGTQRYRPSRLADLRRAARLTEGLEHLSAFARPLVARDLNDPRTLDLNTAYAALAGTRKHALVQASDPAHVADLADLARMVGGDRPILSLNINHVVPPLRFDPVNTEVLIAAARAGLPVHCNVFGQLGASSPAVLAGSVAQTMAETLAGLALVHAVAPEAVAIAGPRAMITDLRTGGLAGGSGEQLQTTAACVAVARHWGWPVSVIAGATDAAHPDAQSGAETALTLLGAAQAGADLITQAAGAQGGLMGLSLAGMVLDNDTCGAIRRALTPPEITPQTLSIDAIRAAATGEGHFLGQPETLARMHRDFLYPHVADRRALDVQDSAPDLLSRATDRARAILNAAPQTHLPRELCRALETRFDLVPHDLPETDP